MYITVAPYCIIVNSFLNKKTHEFYPCVEFCQYSFQSFQLIISIVSLKQLLFKKSSSYDAEHIMGCLLI